MAARFPDRSQNPISTLPLQQVAGDIFGKQLPEGLLPALTNDNLDHAKSLLLAFLTEVGKAPTKHGITDKELGPGVTLLCTTFFQGQGRWYFEEGCVVQFHDRQVRIHDSDAALGYIMSVQESVKPPSRSRYRRDPSKEIYAPLVTLFCLMMKALSPEGESDKMPGTACILARDEKIAIGANIRSGIEKNIIYTKRKEQLTRLFPYAKKQQKRTIKDNDLQRLRTMVHEICHQDFGHCAETYPFLAFLEDNDYPSFTDSVHGFAVDAKNITTSNQRTFNYHNFISYKHGQYWKPPCYNCRTLLGWGYDCS